MTQDDCIIDHFINRQCTFDIFNSEMHFLLNKCNFDKDNLFSNSVCVAVSGGSDSMALLIMASNWAREKNVKFFCVTVDHKLRKESSEEAIFVQDFCKTLGIRHTILEWNRSSNENVVLRDGKLENMARDARYRLITDFCKENDIRFLLTGHTWNDQLETFEMRKNSGSSNFGLAGMSRIRTISNNVKLARPVLHFTKKFLKNFLSSENIKWKNDPMNCCDIFKRVACRKKILTYDNKMLMDFYRKIKMLGKARYETEIETVKFLKDKKKCSFSDFGYAVLDFVFFNMEKKSIQIEIIKRVIWNIGGKKYTININEDILQKIISKEINTIGRCLIKFNKKSIHIFRENRNFVDIIPGKNFDFSGCYVYDDRFLINFKEKSSLKLDLANIVISSCHYQLKDRKIYGGLDTLPKNATFGLPSVLRNNKIIFANGLNYEIEGISCVFMHKVDLFDVFLY